MLDTNELRRIVDEHFRVYEEREEPVGPGVRAHLYFLMVQGDFDAAYEAARQAILAKDPELIVFVRREGGEDILVVAPRPAPTPQKLRLHATLLLLTILTTMSAGAIWWNTYTNSTEAVDFWSFTEPMNLLWGFVTFTVPLMLILGIHESAHFIAAKKHGLRATLPFFLPFPPIPLPIGTLGAFISLKDPLPDRKALFDVGASGPIAGFIVAVPVLVLGMVLTNAAAIAIPDMAQPEISTDLGDFAEEDIDKLLLSLEGPASGQGSIRLAAQEALTATITVTATIDGRAREQAFPVSIDAGEVRHVAVTIPAGTTSFEVLVHWEDGLIRFGDPLLVVALDKAGIGNAGYLSHPTFFAGWVGLLITGINLLPAGQLDGGHVARAVFGDRMRFVAYAAIAGLFYLAFEFSSWMLMALFILFMGLNHPPPLNDRTKLGTRRLVLAVGVLVVFALTFVARPIIL